MDHDGLDRDGLDRDGLDRDGARWIEELPAGLAAQQGLLHGFRAFCQADPDVRWLVVGCSLARGAGDWLSDIDGAVGVEEKRFADVFPRVRSAVDGLGGLVESYHHQLPGLTLTHERIFAQYADRSQLDLVVFQGWCALADLGKYVRRGSAWEALERLHEARAQVWQLWAAVRGVPQPQYGLTSVLDYSASWLPPGIEETVSDLDLGRLLTAGLRVAELLGAVAGQLGEEQRAALPLAMGRFVTGDLRAARAG